MFYKRHFDHRLDILELFLTVRDPGTARAAEAYDGLRKLLINANKGTQLHLAQLAELHRVASAADSIEPILAKVVEFMNQVGLRTVDDTNHPSAEHLYELTGGRGSRLVIDSPAYLSTDGRGTEGVVMRGVAHFEDDPSTDGGPPVQGKPDSDDAPTGWTSQSSDVSDDEKGGVS